MDDTLQQVSFWTRCLLLRTTVIAAVLKFEDELTWKFNKLGYRNVYKVLPNELKVVLLDMIYQS